MNIRVKSNIMRKLKAGTKDMKPRIFVSSTFYDLRYIREDLSNFIKMHDFEPIMFEDGDIGYTPGNYLDVSCYEAMQTADMVLLIIGGNYGSPAAGEQKSEFTEYISATRKEFRTAIKNGIPVFAFIDQKVYSEFETYELNLEFIEKQQEEFNFKRTKDINVFRFIKEIKNIGHISITEFDKINDIKEFLAKQWSDMMKKYLEILKREASEKDTMNAVADIRNLTKRMDVMLDSIGKLILADNNEYAEVKHRQDITKLANSLADSVCVMEEEVSFSKEKVNDLLEVLGNIIRNKAIVPNVTYGWSEGNAEELEKYFEEKGLDFVYLYLTEADINQIMQVLNDSNDKAHLMEDLLDASNYKEIFWTI